MDEKTNPPSDQPAFPKVRLPAVHHWLIGAGLFFFAFWLPLVMAGSIFQTSFPDVAATTSEFAGVFLVLALSFTGLGICCDIIYNVVMWRHLRKNDQQRLSDLCGRTRFDRGRKKLHKEREGRFRN